MYALMTTRLRMDGILKMPRRGQMMNVQNNHVAFIVYWLLLVSRCGKYSIQQLQQPSGQDTDAAIAGAAEPALTTVTKLFLSDVVGNHFKLMIDGAIFSGLAQMGPPGYLDGHEGVWMVPEPVLRAYSEVFWRAGFSAPCSR